MCLPSRVLAFYPVCCCLLLSRFGSRLSLGLVLAVCSRPARRPSPRVPHLARPCRVPLPSLALPSPNLDLSLCYITLCRALPRLSITLPPYNSHEPANVTRHNPVPVIDPGAREAPPPDPTSMFGIFDGHGGAFTSGFCARELVNCLQATPGWKSGNRCAPVVLLLLL